MDRLKLAFFLFLLVALAGCRGVTSSPNEGVVHWAGAQHAAIHEGDAGPKVQLESLLRRPHLFAVGPVEQLSGEITVLDGVPTITTVEGEEFRTRRGSDAGAAFLVWTYAPTWRTIPLPRSVRTLEQLENYLDQLSAAGADAGVAPPFAFRVDAPVESLQFHVLRKHELDPPTMETHEKAKVRSSLPATTVRMIGFFSKEHRGVFTPAGSNVHIHFVTQDGQVAGHVENFVLAPGAVLRLAQPAPPTESSHSE